MSKESYNHDHCCNGGTETTGESILSRPQVANELKELLGQCILVTLAPNQLNILNQVFRPIMCGRLIEVSGIINFVGKINSGALLILILTISSSIY